MYFFYEIRRFYLVGPSCNKNVRFRLRRKHNIARTIHKYVQTFAAYRKSKRLSQNTSIYSDHKILFRNQLNVCVCGRLVFTIFHPEKSRGLAQWRHSRGGKQHWRNVGGARWCTSTPWYIYGSAILLFCIPQECHHFVIQHVKCR